MKIQIYSDLHLEHQECKLPQVLADFAIVAGDIAPSDDLIMKLQKISRRHKLVFYIPGNHDYYGKTISEVHHLLLNCKPSNLIYLYPSITCKIKNYQIVGCTLWFEKEKDDHKKKLIINQLNEIKYIKNTTYDLFVEIGKNHKQWLMSIVDSNTIVITHYLPLKQSISPIWSNSYKNSTYVNNCDEIFLKKRPKLWIHGHTHSPFDYYFDQTRVCCNPCGYPHETKHYKPLVITI